MNPRLRSRHYWMVRGFDYINSEEQNPLIKSSKYSRTIVSHTSEIYILNPACFKLY